MKTRAPTLAAALLLIGACNHGTRRPEALAAAYEHALARGDGEAVYALLAPEVQASTDKEAFLRRFEHDAAERKDAVAALAKIPANERVTGHTVVRTHEGGRSVEYVRVGKRYLVLAGLPAQPRTDTPKAAALAFVAALRTADLAGLDAVADPELLESLREDWETRAEEILAAVEEPDALSLSADGTRAQLRYGAGGTLILVQTAAGWRVSAFE